MIEIAGSFDESPYTLPVYGVGFEVSGDVFSVSDGTYSSLTQTLGSAQAGDTVVIGPGAFCSGQAIAMDKAITLIGSGVDFTTITGQLTLTESVDMAYIKIIGGAWCYITADSSPAGVDDIDGDGDMDGNDLYRLANRFHTTGCSGCPEDLNGDTDVDEEDLIIFIQTYGTVSAGL